jgi:Xaa-Pro dipeptidase
MNEKDARLTEFCRQDGYDGVFIRRRSNVAWATDGADMHCNAFSELGVAALLWTPGRKVVLTNNVDGPRLAAEELPSDWTVEETSWWEIRPALDGHFATDYPDDCLVDLRSCLTPVELDRIRALGAEAAETVEQLAKDVRPGCSELEVAGELISRLRKRGILAPVVLIGGDDRIVRYRHPVPTSHRSERALMIVVCAQRDGLIVALTRLVRFGPLPGEVRRRHDAVCRIDEAYHAATVPGARWCDVLAEGIQAYQKAGWPDEWRRHFQGGPMGYEPRDFWATPTETRRGAPNQAVGWNPSITGTKSEDTRLSTGEVITGTGEWPMNGQRPDILVRQSL